MRIKQISVFVSNEPGRLVDMLKPLIENRININALCVADSTDFGIVRMVVSDIDAAMKALQDAHFTARVNDVLAYDMPHVPGGLLSTIVEPLSRAGINLEYVYAFAGSKEGRARVVFKVRDLNKAEAILGRD